MICTIYFYIHMTNLKLEATQTIHYKNRLNIITQNCYPVYLSTIICQNENNKPKNLKYRKHMTARETLRFC